MQRLRAILARTPITGLALALGLVLSGGGGLLWAGVAGAEIYQWTDSAGRLHFSQDIGKVPRAQRERARQGASERKKRDPLQVYGRSKGESGTRSGPARRSSRLHSSNRTMRIPFERHGTLMRVEVLLNGRVRAPFYIDTGASGVSLPWAVAQQLGIQITDDTPRIRVMTANGVVSNPIVQLQSVQVGPARVDNLQAAVNGSMDVGLLGGAFFNNFVYQVDAAAGIITLKPNQNVRSGRSQQQWRERFSTVRQPLARLEAYLDKGGFTEESRVRELEDHREKLRASLEELEQEANKAGVPRGWRE
jgi:clan AA aspartic protease (TIGR02281 family)